MDSSTAARLIEINRDFYDRFGSSFSATRRRIQPGVHRVLGSLKGNESILDFGCGNGELARELLKRGHRGSYLGVDFSLPLLRDAEVLPKAFSARFIQADLTSPSLMDAIVSSPLQLQVLRSPQRDALRNDIFDIVLCFAVLHHIPSYELRLNILRIVRHVLKDDGLLIISNWQFLNSEKLKARVEPWETVAIPSSAVDTGDYLLDWRGGGKGLRYVHHFDERELDELAHASGFHVSDTFYSDGEGGRLSLYQIWKLAL
jgi:tRNA (uracil-5-)-methyltransferase TRM9